MQYLTDPCMLVSNSFIVIACPQESSLATLPKNILFGPATSQQQRSSFFSLLTFKTGAWRKSWQCQFMIQHKLASCLSPCRVLACQAETQSFHNSLNRPDFYRDGVVLCLTTTSWNGCTACSRPTARCHRICRRCKVGLIALSSQRE
jgi:hypothetical protein